MALVDIQRCKATSIIVPINVGGGRFLYGRNVWVKDSLYNEKKKKRRRNQKERDREIEREMGAGRSRKVRPCKFFKNKKRIKREKKTVNGGQKDRRSNE